MSKKQSELKIREEDRLVVIDLLTNQDGGLVLIPVGTKFQLPNKRGLFFQRLPNKGTYTATIKPTKECKIVFDGSPLQCAFLHSNFSTKCHFMVNGEDNIDYMIAVNPKAFSNFPDTLKEDKTYELPFEIEITNAKGERMNDIVIKEKLLIRAKAFRSAVCLSYQPTKNSLTYQRTLPEDETLHQVGILHVSHNGKVSCAPKIPALELSLETIRHGYETQLHCFCTKQADNDKYQSTNRKIKIQSLTPGECIDIPIFWDMSQTNYNPIEQTHYDFSVRHNEISRMVGGIDLLRDTAEIAPDVRIQIGADKEHLYLSAQEKEETLMPHPIKLAYNQDHVIRYEGDIIFENLAQSSNRNESIGVWDIHTEVCFAHKMDAQRLKLVDNKTLQDVIQINSNNNFIHLRARDKKNIHFRINDAFILAIEAAHDANVTEIEMVLKLSYRLYVDKTGEHSLEFEQGGGKNIDALCPAPLINTIHIRLQKQPSPEWMCVDFGTSAIVAGVSDATHNINYIELKRIKDRLLVAAYPDDSNRHLNEDEVSPFIASSFCLNPDYFRGNNRRDFRYITTHETNEQKSANDYKLYPIWFSPGERVIIRDYQIPCLKNIVGYKYMPNIFSSNDANIREWTYIDHNEQLPLFREQNGIFEPIGDLLLIENLFQLIYKQLFTHYLKTQHSNTNRTLTRQINQLVLTVPNTYTPYNIDTIRKIARETLPSIYPEYLTMVSESDAVACYYLLHRNQFFRSDVMTNEQRTRLRQKESILVYDMGAGTLDLTLFSIEQSQGGNNKTTIDIKSKMGVNIAGNYLDYTIAEILLDIYARSVPDTDQKLQQFKKVLLLSKSEATASGIGSRLRNQLKQFVKNIKTQLNDPEYAIPSLELGNNQFDFIVKSKDILEHHLFEKFINSITKRVLTNFFAPYDKNFELDTVIFSGRSTELNRIRAEVKNTLTNLLPNSKEILYADICDNKFYKTIDFNTSQKHDQLKKVVTEGALAYADRYNRANGEYRFTTRANYATFGVVICDINNNYSWIPLIERGQTWNEKGTILSNVQHISSHGILWIDFIQTYSSNVIADYQNNRFDMISRLYRQQNPDYLYDDLNIQLSYNNQAIERDITSALTLKWDYNDNNKACIQPHEDFNDIELRKSLWPIIF